MQVKTEQPLEDLKKLGKAQKDGRTRIRLQAVVLAREGKTAVEIAQALGAARRAVQDWVARYNRGGVDALKEGRHSGKPPRLKRELEEKLKARLDGGPLPDDGVCTLRGADVRRILEKEFEVVYSLKGVYKLLHRLGYSCLAPRPRHPRAADEPTREAFKKTLWLSSRRSRPLILTSGSTSSSRTRRVSGSRER
jgi:transposase